MVGHGFSERSGDPAQFAGSRANRTAGRRPTTEGVQGNPSRVSPDAAPEQTDLAAFAERVAQLEQRLDSLTVERNTAQKKFAAAETAARQADVARFAESLRAAGRFPPVFDHWGVGEFMQHLASADTAFSEMDLSAVASAEVGLSPVALAEGDSGDAAPPHGDSSSAVPHQPLLSWFQDFLTKLPAVIEFRELTSPASYGSRGTEREPRLVPFVEPRRGMEIDPASVVLAERAEALAAELGVTYAEALTQLRKEHRHTHVSA